MPQSKNPEPQPQDEPQDKPQTQPVEGPGPGSLQEGQTTDEPSDAEAPGPISPEHESGSWEQTLAEQEAQAKEREAADKRKSS